MKNWIPPSFSLTDFLAYFIPGAAALGALGILASCTPLEPYVAAIPWNVGTAVLVGAVAYLVGVVLSSLASSYRNRYFQQLFPHVDAWGKIPLVEQQDQVVDALVWLAPGMGRSWSSAHFFVARSVVWLHAPQLVGAIERQSALSQLRRNSIVPLLLWGIAVVAKSWQAAVHSGAVATIAFSLFMTFAVAIVEYFCLRHLYAAMQRNIEREVREVCSAIVAIARNAPGRGRTSNE